ncbi:MAG: TRAP transporter substrate-binding protein DctP [Acidobacteriota bacterium]
MTRAAPCLLAMLLSCVRQVDGPTPASAELGVRRVLRLGHSSSVTSAVHQAALRLGRDIERATGGELRLSVHPARELGGDQEMIEMARRGQLDLLVASAASLSVASSSMQLLELPFFFPSRADQHRLLDGRVGRRLLDDLRGQGLMGLAFWDGGGKHLTCNRALLSLDDFRGRTFHVVGSEVARDQFECLGGRALPVDIGRAHDALRDGAADGRESTLCSIVEHGLHEVQSHLVLTGHGHRALVVALSVDEADRLGPRHQELVARLARELVVAQREDVRRQETLALEALRDEPGFEIVEVDDRLRSELSGRLLPIAEVNRLTIGTGLVEMALQELDDGRVLDRDAIVIGLDADLQGNSARSGLAIRRGMELAIEEINADGGVLGRRLEMVARDNSMIAARGLANLEYLRNIEQLVAVVGGISSPVALAQLDTIHEHRLIYLDPWAAATGIVANGRDPNYVFRVSVRDEHAAGYLIPRALEISPQVALLLVNNGWGRSNHRAMMTSLEERGLSPVGVEWFDWGEKNWPEKVERLRRLGAGVIVYVGNGVEGARFVELLSRLETPMPVVSHWGITGADFADLAGDSLDRVDLRVLQSFSFIGNERAESLVERYSQRYGVVDARGIVAPVGTAHAYDLVHLLARAIRRAGTTERPMVREALERVEQHEGVVKRYAPPFTPDRHDALDSSSFLMARYEEGVLVPLGATRR